MARRKAQASKKPRNGFPRPVRPNVLANNQDVRPVIKRSTRSRRGGAAPATRHVRAVCSITDPFCPASKNSKWPDGTSGNTLTEQFRGNLSPTTTATGEACVAFLPGVPFGYLASTVVTGSPPVATFAAAASTYKVTSLLATYGSLARIVSWGVIARCTASATNASGLLTFGTGSPPAVSSALSMGDELFDEVVIKAIQPGLELTWISVPRGTGARDFTAQSTTTSGSFDWSCLTAFITGGGNVQAPINFEWFINVEFTSLPTARTLSAISQPNPPSIPAAVTATSHVHATLGSIIEGGVSVVEKKVADAASAALKTFSDDPLTSIASLFSFL